MAFCQRELKRKMIIRLNLTVTQTQNGYRIENKEKYLEMLLFDGFKTWILLCLLFRSMKSIQCVHVIHAFRAFMV